MIRKKKSDMRLVRVIIVSMFLTVMICSPLCSLGLFCGLVFIGEFIKRSNGRSLIFKVATKLSSCYNKVVRCFERVSF